MRQAPHEGTPQCWHDSFFLGQTEEDDPIHMCVRLTVDLYHRIPAKTRRYRSCGVVSHSELREENRAPGERSAILESRWEELERHVVPQGIHWIISRDVARRQWRHTLHSRHGEFHTQASCFFGDMLVEEATEDYMIGLMSRLRRETEMGLLGRTITDREDTAPSSRATQETVEYEKVKRQRIGEMYSATKQVIPSRIHDRDLSASLQFDEYGWRHLKLPLDFAERCKVTLHDTPPPSYHYHGFAAKEYLYTKEEIAAARAAETSLRSFAECLDTERRIKRFGMHVHDEMHFEWAQLPEADPLADIRKAVEALAAAGLPRALVLDSDGSPGSYDLPTGRYSDQVDPPSYGWGRVTSIARHDIKIGDAVSMDSSGKIVKVSHAGGIRPAEIVCQMDPLTGNWTIVRGVPEGTAPSSRVTQETVERTMNDHERRGNVSDCTSERWSAAVRLGVRQRMAQVERARRYEVVCEGDHPLDLED